MGEGRGRDNENADWAGIYIWNIYLVIFCVYWINGDIGQLFYVDKYFVPAPPRSAPPRPAPPRLSTPRPRHKTTGFATFDTAHLGIILPEVELGAVTKYVEL